MLYQNGLQNSLKNLFFLISPIFDSQTLEDKIVGKTQENSYFFPINGYLTSNTNYYTPLEFPLAPFFNVDTYKA